MTKQKTKDIEIGTLVEDFTDKLTFIAEQVIGIKETQDKQGTQLNRMEATLERMDVFKADRGEVKKLEHRIVSLESKI